MKKIFHRILSTLFLANFCMTIFTCTYAQEQYIYSFGSKTKKEKNEININNAIRYDSEGGFGFDFGTEKDIFLKNNCLISDKPFYFSFKLQEGAYKITVRYVPQKNSFTSTIRAESRRNYLNQYVVHSTGMPEQTFVVQVKDAKISTTETIKLKERERHKLDWDDKLTLEFQGQNFIESIRVESAKDITSIFLAGNSTVVNQEEEPWASWGQMIPAYFDDQVVVVNQAESGLSLGSFLSAHRFNKILTDAQPGDYLFVEFGHNDQKEIGEHAGAFLSYSDRLRLFVREFRKKGGIPVIVTSTARRAFDDDGNVVNTLGDFPEAARMVADELNVPVIDLNLMTTQFYQALGVEGSKKALVHYAAETFPNQPEPLADNTHFNTYGAHEIALMVLQGIEKSKLPLAKHIQNFDGYDPIHPHDWRKWNWPPSMITGATKPDGN